MCMYNMHRHNNAYSNHFQIAALKFWKQSLVELGFFFIFKCIGFAWQGFNSGDRL